MFLIQSMLVNLKEKKTVVFVTISVLFLLVLCAQTDEQKKKRSKDIFPGVPGGHTHHQQSGITCSLQSIDFSMVSCWGDSSQEIITIEFLLFTKRAAQKVLLSNYIRVIDNRGLACAVKEVSLNLYTTSAGPEHHRNNSSHF